MAAAVAIDVARYESRVRQPPRGPKLDWVPGAVVAKYHAQFVEWANRASELCRLCGAPADVAAAFRSARAEAVSELAAETARCIASDRRHDAVAALVARHARAQTRLERILLLPEAGSATAAWQSALAELWAGDVAEAAARAAQRAAAPRHRERAVACC